jgi:predicted permease
VGIRDWFRRHRLDEDDFKEEIRAHIEIAAEERIADGSDRRDARYEALREFGNVTLTTEAARRVWTPRWVEPVGNVMRDVRYALRTLARQPAFSLTVIAVLTLGIGLNAAVFTMVKALALSPIAGVADSGSLSVVYGESNAGRPVRLSYPDYRHLRDHNQAFSGLFGSVVATVALGRGRHSRVMWTELVTGNYFQVLGVRATLGRTLLPSDEIAPGRHPVVVISDGFWRRDFGADPDIVGKTIEINSVALTVVGVADPTFHGTTVVYDVEAYVPVMMAPQLGFPFGSRETTPSGILSDRRAAIFYPQGYLRHGVSQASAGAQTDALWTAVQEERPATDRATGSQYGPDRLRVAYAWQTPNGAASYVLPTLIVLSVMAFLVLMIACANIAGLVLVRGVSRRGEIALRLALGAARTRIIRLLLVENLLLAIPGAILGVLLAQSGIPVLVAYAEDLAAPQRIFFNIEVDRLVIAFTAFVACASAIAFGFFPAMQSSRVDLVSVINEDASPRGAARGRLRGALVVAQVAVSVLLLVSAGLVTRTLEAVRNAYPGFAADTVASVSLDVKQNGYDVVRGREFYRDVLTSLRDTPGVGAATLAFYEPMNLVETRAQRVTIADYEPRWNEDLDFLFNIVASDYFRTLEVPLLAGREFRDGDDDAAQPVAVINRTFAERFWGDAGNAIGKRIRVGTDAEWRTVVGVAADLKYLRINEPPRPYVYLPFLQAYRPAMNVHTSGTVPVEQLVKQTRATLEAIDPHLPVEYARPLAERLQGASIFYNLAATMLTIFGIAGLALSALGTYGLVSYVVRQSTHEIGIRIALGASGCSVIRRFMAQGLTLGLIGAVIGVIGALAIGDLIRGVLFGVSTTDPRTFGVALAVVLTGVLLATLVPAWRAARTNPLEALRHQ